MIFLRPIMASCSSARFRLHPKIPSAPSTARTVSYSAASSGMCQPCGGSTSVLPIALASRTSSRRAASDFEKFRRREESHSAPENSEWNYDAALLNHHTIKVTLFSFDGTRQPSGSCAYDDNILEIRIHVPFGTTTNATAGVPYRISAIFKASLVKGDRGCIPERASQSHAFTRTALPRRAELYKASMTRMFF